MAQPLLRLPLGPDPAPGHPLLGQMAQDTLGLEGPGRRLADEDLRPAGRVSCPSRPRLHPKIHGWLGSQQASHHPSQQASLLLSSPKCRSRHPHPGNLQPLLLQTSLPGAVGLLRLLILPSHPSLPPRSSLWPPAPSQAVPCFSLPFQTLELLGVTTEPVSQHHRQRAPGPPLQTLPLLPEPPSCGSRATLLFFPQLTLLRLHVQPLPAPGPGFGVGVAQPWPLAGQSQCWPMPTAPLCGHHVDRCPVWGCRRET